MSADAQPEQAPPSLELSKLVATATPALKRMAPRLMGAALRQRCRESDLVQSALVEAIASIPSFKGRGEDEFVGWTLRIMERNAIDRQRRLMAAKRSIKREQAEGEMGLQDLAGTQHSPSQAAAGCAAAPAPAGTARVQPAEGWKARAACAQARQHKGRLSKGLACCGPGGG